jgi:hypothetical protein
MGRCFADQVGCASSGDADGFPGRAYVDACDLSGKRKDCKMHSASQRFPDVTRIRQSFEYDEKN